MTSSTTTTTTTVYHWSFPVVTVQGETMMSASGNSKPSLVRHLEGALGTIVKGWTQDPSGRELGFSVVQFALGSDERSIAYSTLGLSKFVLGSTVSDKDIYQELLILAPRSLSEALPASLLGQAGSMLIKQGSSVLRGEVLGPIGPLSPGSDMTHLYATVPVYFPPEFAELKEDGKAIAIVWLVPISSPEAEFVSTHGWNAFEDWLEERDPALSNWSRPDSGPLRLHS
ncbi:suppressor of fused domain protein [Isoptericola halotolerans]|uniref:Suppressor of fused-like domain-containing protein n=1 Tax=Isoptericola halotolerans TaxID=300560 RepID=A0ABX2A3W8_9MICO|nr:hypothetical protein [Isoptericola halotolerans]